MVVITTCFGTTGPCSGSTYVKNYWDKQRYGCFICACKWDLICTNNQFLL